ncbi:MAG: SpoIIE family protein phosphatase [Isosphaeraceae bacterium]
MAARRILMVDDSRIMRSMIGDLLQDEGYEVATAEDGRQGLEKARLVKPELILSDYEMPEMDGPAFCRALKADPDEDLRATPVLLLTTLGAIESRLTGLDAGADDYIEKPKTPDDIRELFARIRAQLRIADLRRELAVRNLLLETANARMDFELDLARKVQSAIMPKPPTSRGGLTRIAVRYRPANRLGGDVYDFVRRDDGRLAVLVADVSGHGVNSALLSGMVRTMFGPLGASSPTPARALAGLDQAVEKFFPEGYFCTGFCLFLDESTVAFDYAGVGHPSAILFGSAGSRLLASDPGLLGIGLVEPDSLASGTAKLEPGESLLIYTDGLTDAMNPEDVLFGEPRIRAVLEVDPQSDASTILDRIEAEVACHVHPGHAADDINLVLIQNPLA